MTRKAAAIFDEFMRGRYNLDRSAIRPEKDVKAMPAASQPTWFLESCFISRRPDPVAAEKLHDFRSMRGRILYDRGRRPEFRSDRREYVDVQDMDLGAWHFVARRNGDEKAVGYIRVAAPGDGCLFQTQLHLGEDRYAGLLEAEGLCAGEVYEGGRMVVDASARGKGLGAHLLAVSLAAARALGVGALVGIAGTADGQTALFRRFGFRIVPGSRAYIEHYTEDVVAVLNRISEGAGEFERLVEHMSTDGDLLSTQRRTQIYEREG